MSDDITTSDEGGSSTSSTTHERTFTQSEVNHLVNERLARQKAQYADYADLKAQVGQLAEVQAQNQQLQTDLASMTNDFNLAASDAMKLKVAVDKNVPASLVERLRGNTPDEIAADADTLVSLVGSQRRGFDGGQQGSTPNQPDSPDASIRRLAGY